MKFSQIAYAIIPFLSLFTIHILGFAAHSEFALISMLSTGMLTNLMWVFLANVVFAFLMARLVIFLGRGLVFKLVTLSILEIDALERFRRGARILAVVLICRKIETHWFVAFIGLIIFNLYYLGSAFFAAFLICLIPLGVAAYFVNSEESLLISASMLRGKKRTKLRFDKRGFLPFETPSEERVSKLLSERLFGNALGVITIVLLAGSYSSYSFGKIRSSYLRENRSFSWEGASNLSYIVGDGQSVVLWDQERSWYRVVYFASDKELQLQIKEGD
jgi:hypothetical protein